MKLFISVTTAWLCTLGVFILSIIYLLRILAKKSEIEWIANLNKKFRKIHTPLCHVTLLLAILHGLFSSIPIISANPGTLATFLILLMGLLAMLKKKLKKFWMPSHRIMTLMVCVLVVIHIYQVGFVGMERYLQVFYSSTNELLEDGSKDISQNDSNNDDLKIVDKLTFNDGEFEGISNGFGEKLTVKVLVENSEIVSVEIVSHNEVGEHIYGKAFNSVPFEIINKQTTDVESVSGATYSSYGIMLAVEDALKDAVKTGKLPVIELPRGIRLK